MSASEMSDWQKCDLESADKNCSMSRRRHVRGQISTEDGATRAVQIKLKMQKNSMQYHVVVYDSVIIKAVVCIILSS